MIRPIAFAAKVLLFATAANAADHRVQVLPYEPDQVVKLHGRAGIQSTIEFAPDERIENVAVGDSSAWQVTPNRRASLLFLKPLAGASRTNMTVVTDRRTYMFDLVAAPRSGVPIYALRFKYDDLGPVAPAAGTEAAVQNKVELAHVPPVTPDRLNFGWKMKGTGRLLPARAFDDGASLYLSWSRETPLPAILTMSEESREGPLDYRVAGDYVVVTPIPSNILLRYGRKTATIWPTQPAMRNAPAMPAPAPAQTTPSPQVAAARPAAQSVLARVSIQAPDVASLMIDNLSGADDAE